MAAIDHDNQHTAAIGQRGQGPGNIKEQSIKAVGVTFTEQGLLMVIGTSSTIVLARLLTPDDYGLIAMVTAVTVFVELFRECGLSMATIQGKTLTRDQVNALFWINAGLGVVFTMIIAALGPFLAWFYRRPELLPITAAISVTSVIGSLGTQHGALLYRQMKFRARAVIRVSSLLAGFAAAVIVALSGGRYWALVAKMVVDALWHTAGLWLACRFRPGRFTRGAKVSSHLSFGLNFAGSQFFGYLHRNIDQVLIGRAWGSEQLGLYGKAHALLMLPISNLRAPLGRVAFAVLSRIQDDPTRFRSYFNKYIAAVAFSTMPLIVYLFVTSENLIRFLLGPQWVGAAELFSILAFASFIQPVAILRGSVLLTLGFSGKYFWYQVYTGIAAVLSFAVGLPWGARGVALAYTIGTYLTLHPLSVYAFRNTPVRPIDFYRSMARPVWASVFLCATLLPLRLCLAAVPDVLTLAMLLIASVLIYIAVYCLLPGGKREIFDFRDHAVILLQSVKGKISKTSRS